MENTNKPLEWNEQSLFSILAEFSPLRQNAKVSRIWRQVSSNQKDLHSLTCSVTVFLGSKNETYTFYSFDSEEKYNNTYKAVVKAITKGVLTKLKS